MRARIKDEGYAKRRFSSMREDEGKDEEAGEDYRSRRREVQWRKEEGEEDKEEKRLLKTGTVENRRRRQ
jgi:hypothetical protein